MLERLPTNGHQKAQQEEGAMPPWRSNRLLRTFESHEQTRLFNAGRWVTYKPNEVVSQQSEAVEAIVFIVEGKARAEISSPHTSPRIAVVNLLGPGDDIGLLSLVDGAPHSATVTALTELRAVSIPFQELRERLLAHPDRYRVLAEIAIERLRLSGGWLQALI
jgi:CRP/FNR family transcriptional regulator